MTDFSSPASSSLQTPIAPSTPAAGLHFSVAETLEDVTDAWHLLYHVYRRVGYISHNPYELHTTPHAIGENNLVVSAKIQGLTVGTISAISDGTLGLPLDSVYKKELDALRQQGRKLMEIGLFGDRRQDFDRSFMTILELMRYTFFFGDYQGITDCICGIPPRRAKLYAKAFGFEVIGEPTSYASVLDNPVVLLRFSREYITSHINKHKAVEHFAQNPLPPETYANRFRFEPSIMAGSLLQKYLGYLAANKTSSPQ